MVAIAGALLGVATGCGAEPADKEAGLLVYDVGPENGTASAGLFIVDDQGRNRRRLTSEPPPTNVTSAEWSPRGGTILFRSELYEAEEFWTIEADGTRLRRIGKGGGASWSPDGSEIAIGDGSDEISIVDTRGALRRTIRLGIEEGLYPGPVGPWSPDGSLMAISVTNESTESLIYVVPTDGKSRAKPLGKREEGVSEEFATWSPDGRLIAFVRVYADASDAQEVWVMRRDGTDRRRIATGAQDVRWSADGKALLFSASYPLAPGLYRVKVAGGDPVRIGDKFDETEDFREPGGKRVLDLDLDRGKLVVSRLDGSGKKVLTEPHQDAAPRWSPDGTRIAFIRGSEGEEPWDVYVIGADGKGERRITTGGHPVWLRDGRLLIRRKRGYSVAGDDPGRIAIPADGERHAISPDGNSIAVIHDRVIPYEWTRGSELLEIQSTLFLQRADGTGVRELAKTAGNAGTPLVFEDPIWTPDGRSVFIQEEDPLGGGSTHIRQILIGAGAEKSVPRDDDTDVELFAVSPDGTKLALTTQSTIDVVDLDGKGRKTVWSDDRLDVSDLRWSPDGEKLAYIGWHPELEGVYQLFVMDADGSDRRLVSKPGDAVGAFDWAP